MAKLCKVTVMFQTLLNADPIEGMPKDARDNAKLKVAEKRLLEKHPTLLQGGSNITIISCVESTLAKAKEKGDG